MTLTLAATQSVSGLAGTASVITYTIFGDEITAGVDDFKVLAQGQLSASAATLYAAPSGKSAIVKEILLANTSGSVVTVAMHVNGTGAANKVAALSIPANGSASWNGEWSVYDAAGFRQYVGSTGPTGNTGPAGLVWIGNWNSGTTYALNEAVYYAATGQSYRSLQAGNLNHTPPAVSDAWWQVIALKGDTGTAGSPGTPGVVQGISALDSSVVISGTAANPVVGLDADLIALAGVATTAFGRGHLALANSAAATAQLDLATGTLKGLLAPGDKKIIDNLHYDIVADFGWVGNDSTDNQGGGGPTAFTAIMAALPSGARLFFPAGTYRVSTVLDINVDKRITFQGIGRYASIIKTTSATAHIFHKTVAGWYDTWMDLGFQSSVTRTAGAAINITPGNNVGMNVYRCWMTGMFWGINADGAQSANLSVWADLDISAVANGGRGLRINGSTINLMIHNTTINAGAATTSACCEIRQSGAVQVTASDWIMGTNVLLIDSSEASGAGPQACYFTNCFFDQPAGSVVLVKGTRTANRIKFMQCGIAPTGNNHGIEFNGTGAGAIGTETALPAGISIVDCDIYSQNGTNTGAGILLNGVGDVNIQNSRITGFNGAGGSGIKIIPSASNQTKVRINGNIIGPNSNLTVTNLVGIRIEAGASALGFLSITDNSLLGNGTAILDASAALATATKNIRDNQGAAAGLQASATAGGTLTTTTETIYPGLQLFLPANSIKVGTRFEFSFGDTVSATSTTVAKIRIGTAGTTGDATNASGTSAASGAAAAVFCEGSITFTSIGAAAAFVGTITFTQAALAGAAVTVTITGTVNTTVGNYVSVTVQNGTANTRTFRGGSLICYSPA